MKAILVWLILFSPLYSFAQSQTYSFAGTLSLHDGTRYSYKLQFRDSSGHISGYSITDIMGPDQTKTAISGTIDFDKKELLFHELKLLETSSSTNKDSFCYVNAHLRMSKRKGSNILKGSFTACMAHNNSECAKGDITLMSTADMLDKLMKILPAKDTVLRKKLEAVKEAQSAPKELIQLSLGNTFEAICDGSTASLQLWDDKDIDGDVVSVQLNGKTILDHYTLDGHKKQLLVKLSPSVADTIACIANNEGSSPPNTARLHIASGSAVYDINASTTIGTPVYILLRHKDK